MSNMPIGVKYPIRLGKTGYFEQTFTTLDEAKSNITHLLLTNKGERLMQPEFGTDIYKLLFENIVLDWPEVITNNIKQAVLTWLPHVFLQSVDVDSSRENIDNNMIKISVTYGVRPNVTELDTINLEFAF